MTGLSRTLQAAYTVAAAAGGAIVYTIWTRALGLAPWALVDLALLVAFGWLWLNRLTLLERADEACDTADQAVGRIEAVENHLSGLETPGRGRHARPSPHPRAAA